MRGANIVMPKLTPPEYRVKYEIYRDKACVNETAEMCRGCLQGRVEAVGHQNHGMMSFSTSSARVVGPTVAGKDHQPARAHIRRAQSVTRCSRGRGYRAPATSDSRRLKGRSMERKRDGETRQR